MTYKEAFNLGDKSSSKNIFLKKMMNFKIEIIFIIITILVSNLFILLVNNN